MFIRQEAGAMNLRKKRKLVRPKTKLGLPDLEQAKAAVEILVRFVSKWSLTRAILKSQIAQKRFAGDRLLPP